MNTGNLILSFANNHSNFTFGEVADFVGSHTNISDSGILWHIKKLIQSNLLSRISRGIYSKTCVKEFTPSLSAEVKEVYFKLKKAFPLIEIVAYSGDNISTLQHHISANNAIYIEVSREATEAVFHYLTDRTIKAYHKPSTEFMNDYVDLSEKPIIIKPLITEAPTQIIDSVRMPSLEKILVDINADPDFYFLQDSETYYILENAYSLYAINVPKMLRYASRRGIRKKLETIIQSID